jgi:hypothetical protein
MEIYVKETFSVGNDIFIASDSEKFNNYHVVFEDDTQTGYFYALDTNFENNIQDAVHIYNVKDIVDKNIPSEIIITWSEDGLKSILYINNYPHAIIDFENKKCYCRTGFPPKDKKSKWSSNGHEWNEEIYKEIIGK